MARSRHLGGGRAGLVLDSALHSRWKMGQSLPISRGTGRLGTIPALTVKVPRGVRTTTWQVSYVWMSPWTQATSMGFPGLPGKVRPQEGDDTPRVNEGLSVLVFHPSWEIRTSDLYVSNRR